MLIRGDWTTLTYIIDISEQRDALFKGTFHWTLPEKTDVKGEEVTGAKSFEGTWTALGVVDWDGTTVEVVSLKDVQRHVGTWKTPTRSASSTARSATTPGSAARPASGKVDAPVGHVYSRRGADLRSKTGALRAVGALV
jgi:hypothetical protein